MDENNTNGEEEGSDRVSHCEIRRVKEMLGDMDMRAIAQHWRIWRRRGEDDRVCLS